MTDFLSYLRARKSQLKQEILELEAAERIFLESGAKRQSGGGIFASVTASQSSTSSPVPKHPGAMTIKQQVKVVLEDASPEGLSAQEILRQIKKRWTPSLVRTSLSPQLSRLRKERVIFNHNNVWYLS